MVTVIPHFTIGQWVWPMAVKELINHMLVMIISNENVSKLTGQIIQTDKYVKYTTITKLTLAWMRQ